MKQRFDGESRADADLARNVRLFLGAHRNGFQRITVWAESGTVRLSGPVGSFFLRQMAIAMAKRVAGVRHVVDDLEVDLPRQIARSRVT
jgi:osmotically-inducible protein OsmY